MQRQHPRSLLPHLLFAFVLAHELHRDGVTATGFPLRGKLPCSFLSLPTILSVAALSWQVNSQNPPPLAGQGVSPMEEGLTDRPTNVTVSVELVKLLELDESAYTFTGIFNFLQFWEDPRSAESFRIINAARQAVLSQQAANRQACSTQNQSTSNVTSSECSAALSPGLTNPCTRYCITYGGGQTPDPLLCCDMVWVPDVELRNLIDWTQDGLVINRMLPLYDTDVEQQQDVGQQQDTRKVVGTWWLTQVLGMFSAHLDFHKFPFDSQWLRVLLSRPLGVAEFYVILPGSAYRRLSVQFQAERAAAGNATELDLRAVMHKDELAGWSIVNVTMECALGNASLDVPVEGSAALPQNFLVTQATRQVCPVGIHVDRLSSMAVTTSILPALFTSVLSFTVFFMRPDALDTRLGVEITVFLALTATQFIFNDMLPLTSYATDLDVFVLLSYAVILSIVAENLVVSYISTRGDNKKRSKAAAEPTVGGNGESSSPHGHDVMDSEALQKSKRLRAKASLKVVLESSKKINLKLAEDESFAYRVACKVDVAAGCLLFITFVILTVLNFTIGLS